MSEQIKSRKPLIVFIIMLFLVLALWLLSMLLLNNNSNRGTFGDMFGAVNALFSGLAFAGLIYTILLQKEELELQRNEITETKQEFITQNNTLKSQRFENTFFNMLDLHHKIVDGIDINERKSVGVGKYQMITIKGRDVFKEEYSHLLGRFEHNRIMDYPKSRDLVFMEFYETVQTDFGHYFRNVYRIIKLVNTTDFYPLDKESKLKESMNFEERYKYTSILRAQLSDYEILWLFYNCLSKKGIDKFKPLIEKYCIFKNIPTDKLFNIKEYEDYSLEAYKI